MIVHPWKTWGFWKQRLMELTAAGMMAFLVIQLSTMVSQRQKVLMPPGAWFAVHEIYVPDHQVGSNPPILYDRDIRSEFTGFWIVEVQKAVDNALFAHQCSGFGTSHYEPDEVIEDNTVTWEWLIGRPCPVGPGQYRLRATWSLRNPGWPEKTYTATSNLFMVTP